MSPRRIRRVGGYCAARVIRGGRGVSGDNRDYLENTVVHLDALGITDGRLHRLLEMVEGRAG